MNQAYKKVYLDNGLKIVAFSMPKMRSLALGIWIKTGGRYETAKDKGISHFLEHLLFKGSKKYSCRQIKESIEGIGGSLNGFTSEELTCYLVKIPANHLEVALNILADMVLNPTLPALEIEKEKQVIIEEIKMYRDLPQSYVYELLDELLWPAQPLGAPVIGTVDSVSSISREALLDFKGQFYATSNIVISAAGLLDFKKLTKQIEGIFLSQKKKESSQFLPAKDSQDAPQIRVFPKNTEQTHMALGFRSFKRDHPLRHASGLLHIVLGANMSSRLFNEVREVKGLAYEIGTVVKRFQDTGAFIVHAGIDNQKVTQATQVILKELGKISSHLITQDEFRRARDYYLGQLELALEDTLDHMLWIGETTATLDKTYSLAQIIQEVNRVTRGDIRKAARSIFEDKKLSLALIGPLENYEDEISKYLRIN